MNPRIGWASIVAAGVLGGGLGGLVTAGLTSSPAPTSGAPSVAADGGAVELQSTHQALEALRERVAALEEAPLRTPRPVERQSVVDAVAREDLERLREELLSAIDAAGRLGTPGASEPDPVFRELVRKTLDDVRLEEQVKGVQRYQEGRLDRLDQDVAGLTVGLSLSAVQSDELRRALLVQYEREEDLRRRWEEGVDDEVLGEEKDAMYAEFQADLESFLEPEQVTGFWTAVKGG
ncbi:MAG: hypothetical protein AAFZ65_09765 [Planctomycetota bacterium]